MMTLFARWFGRQYNDAQLVAHAKNALAADPRLMDVSGVSIDSAKGVVSLTGTVHKSTEKERSEGVVRDALRTAGLKYERIINEIKVG